jgi:ankyrin repeat protein
MEHLRQSREYASALGCLYRVEDVVKLLHETGANMESKDAADRTPLSWAAGNGRKAVVELLLVW